MKTEKFPLYLRSQIAVVQLLQKSGTHLDGTGHCKLTKAHGFFCRHSNVLGQLLAGKFGANTKTNL